MNARFAEFSNLGFAELSKSCFVEAVAAFQRAAIFQPDQAISLYGAGFGAVRQSRWRDGLRLISRAAVALSVDVSPRLVAEVHITRGYCQKALGSLREGAMSYRRAAVSEPSNQQIYFNLANTLGDLGEHDAAARTALCAAVVEPGLSRNWNTAGRFLAEAHSLPSARCAYRRALVLEPGHEHAWNNLGILHKRRDCLVAALRSFSHAHRIDPKSEQVLANLGRNLLLTGDLAKGWERLEAPWKSRGFAPREDTFRLPIWEGNHLQGRRLLVWSEEKIGDEILFATMLEEARQRAGALSLLCNPRIAGLLGRALPLVEVRGWDGVGEPPVDLASHAACYPLEYVGRFLRRSFADFPPPVPLLTPSAHVEAGGDDGAQGGKPFRLPRVGIHWKSINPLIGDYKTLPLVEWAPILSSPGIDFISLQYGAVTDDIAEVQRIHGVGPRIPVGVDQIADVEGFVNYVASLDLVLSVAGTTAHVSGGLGRPTWLLLPRGPGLSWFWFEKHAASPWYARCRLYRQSVVGSWRGAVEEVCRDLADWRDQFTGNASGIIDFQTTLSH